MKRNEKERLETLQEIARLQAKILSQNDERKELEVRRFLVFRSLTFQCTPATAELADDT